MASPTESCSWKLKGQQRHYAPVFSRWKLVLLPKQLFRSYCVLPLCKYLDRQQRHTNKIPPCCNIVLLLLEPDNEQNLRILWLKLRFCVVRETMRTSTLAVNLRLQVTSPVNTYWLSSCTWPSVNMKASPRLALGSPIILLYFSVRQRFTVGWR